MQREADERGHAPSGKEIEIGIDGFSRPVIGVLAGNDALPEERVRETIARGSCRVLEDEWPALLEVTAETRQLAGVSPGQALTARPLALARADRPGSGRFLQLRPARATGPRRHPQRRRDRARVAGARRRRHGASGIETRLRRRTSCRSTSIGGRIRPRSARNSSSMATWSFRPAPSSSSSASFRSR